MPILYVVLGANGRAGGEAARALIERGEAVCVVLRRKDQGEKWAALSAEVAVASIGDANAMADALKGRVGSVPAQSAAGERRSLCAHGRTRRGAGRCSTARASAQDRCPVVCRRHRYPQSVRDTA